MTKREPVRLSAIVVAALNIAVIFGGLALSQAQVTLLGTSAEVIAGVLTPLVVAGIQTVQAWWLRRKVSPEATTRPLAAAVLAAHEKDARPNPQSLAAAERVLG